MILVVDCIMVMISICAIIVVLQKIKETDQQNEWLKNVHDQIKKGE